MKNEMKRFQDKMNHDAIFIIEMENMEVEMIAKPLVEQEDEDNDIPF